MMVQSSNRRLRVARPTPAGAGLRRLTWLCAGAALLGAGAAGCGGSSDGGGSSFGGLSAQVFWQQPDGAAGLSGTSPGGGFGPELPAAVRTVRLDFAPASGVACCVAIDPAQLAVDPDTGRRRVVVTRLAAGEGLLTIAGFPGSTATAPPDVAATCEVEPAAVASPCVTGGLDGPSFLSAPTAVTVRAGTQVNAGDILVPAVPFFITGTLQPAPGSTASSPVALGATVAIAGTELPIDRISIATVPGGAAAVTLTPCDDLAGPPCSPGGALAVRGLRAVGQNAVAPGSATVEIAASGDGVAPLSLSYGFTASGAPPTATRTAVATATTAPVTPSTPVATRTQTPLAATPTFTPTPTTRATATSGSPTATPDAMCGATPAVGCLRPLDGSRSSLVVGDDDNPAEDRLVYEWERGNFVDGRDFGDPGLTTAYAVCIYDDVGGVSTLARQLFLPPTTCTGNGCWSVTDSGFRYDDSLGRRDGIERIDLVAGQPGRANILVRAGGTQLSPPDLPFAQDPTVIIQIKNDFEEGQCWETRFSRPAERNDSALFRDTGDNAIGN